VNTYDLEDDNPTVKFQMSPIVKFKPQISDLSNGWDLPLQEEVTLDPMEYKKVDLGIKVILPKGYCALLMNKSSARVKYGVHVYLGLIDIGFHNYMQTVLQNVTKHPIVLQAGTAVAQLLVIRSEIPKFELGWDDLESRDGSFGSTGQKF
jgi:dUTP pyrophosphatase